MKLHKKERIRMFKLFSRKSKIKELEAKLDAVNQSINFYSKKYCELKEVSISQHHELQHLKKEVEALKPRTVAAGVSALPVRKRK
jgi:hypothetical protein